MHKPQHEDIVFPPQEAPVSPGPVPWTRFLALPEAALPQPDTPGAGRVLIMLSEPSAAAVLALCLSTAGFVTRVESSWSDGVAAAHFVPDVVVVDSREPEFQGSTIVRQLRTGEPEGARAAVITLIRSEADLDLTLGLEWYPCDFVLIPTSARELALRIEDIVRVRRGRHVGPHGEPRRHYTVGPLEVDIDRHTVLVNGEEIRISTLEMRLLADLIEHRGHVRNRKDLLERVWQYSANVTTRTPDTHVNRLRMKLGAAGPLIETVRGLGYRLSSQFPVVAQR